MAQDPSAVGVTWIRHWDSPSVGRGLCLVDLPRLKFGVGGGERVNPQFKIGDRMVGDPDGYREFEGFFNQVKHSCMRQALLLTGNPQEAEDLVQEALTRTWEHWSKVCRLNDPAAWTRRVLHNLAVSSYRRSRVRRAFGTRHGSECVDGARGESSSFDVDPDTLMIIAGVAHLPMSQRRALVLHAVAGLTASEIASDMNASEATVRTWLSRARITLRDYLQDQSEPPFGTAGV